MDERRITLRDDKVEDSNESLWQQYLVAYNKFQETQKGATYSSRSVPEPAILAEAGKSVEESAIIDDTKTIGNPQNDDNELKVGTSPSPSNTPTINQDQDQDDIVINFDTEDTATLKKEEFTTTELKGSAEVTPYQSTSSPHVNDSRGLQLTFEGDSEQQLISSETSRISAIEGKLLENLRSISAAPSRDFEHKQLIPAPLFNPTAPPEALESESDSDSSDEIIYHPDRFDMAKRRRNKAKESTVAQKAPNKAKEAEKPNYPVASREVKEELKELQEVMISRTGLRARGIPEEGTIVTNKALALARQGDGTDPNSDVAKYYRSLVTDIPSTKLIGYHEPTPEPMDPSSMQVARIVRNTSLDDHMVKLQAPWVRYYEDTPVNDEPDPDSILVWNLDQQVQTSNGEYLAKSPVVDEYGRPANWENSFGSSNPLWLTPCMMDNQNPQFLLVFRNWLETSVGLPEPIITNRQSFYDGTAHSDGITSMFITELDEVIAFLDYSDKENVEHSHETSSGFIFNAHTRKVQDEAVKEAGRIATQTDHRSMLILKPEENPNVPRANIYLRPVENHDIHELTALYNWYVHNTLRTLDTIEITEQDMLDRKNECQRENMPFIVAIERRLEMRGRSTQTVVGFASATDFTGSMTASRHTAELDLFVHHERLQLGIANCLIDKLLSVCDRTFARKQGYHFDASPLGRAAYSAGGNRELNRLIFIIHFQASDPSDYLWIKDWLESKFMFEEQGLLKGVAYKQDKVMNTSYLVRKSGFDLVDKKHHFF